MELSSIEEILKNHLSPDQVDSAEAASVRYGSNTLGLRRKFLGAVRPTTVSHIQSIVHLSQKHAWPLYTISTGRNWGYGSALPVRDGAILLDLSHMNRILEFDPQLGTVTVEPGVTQQQLYDHIQQQGWDFMVPTSGAGPAASLLGNALEKGYGITPYEDHFGALMSLKAVLPSGDIYQSALAERGANRSDSIFKWKLGPYLDGLFVQSNLGIVVQGTFALARKPENVTQFLVFLDDTHFEDAVEAIASIKQRLGPLLGGVNLLNKRRILSMTMSDDHWPLKDPLGELTVRQWARQSMITDWTIVGGIYGPNEIVAGARRRIAKEFQPFSKRTIFLSRQRVEWAEKLLKWLPLSGVKKSLASAKKALDILEGVPSQVALPLAYLKNPRRPAVEGILSPDQDGCGLIWFAPLLPLDPPLVRDYCQEVTRICMAEGIEPLITLTAFSERCFDSTIPILFDLNDPGEIQKARQCYDQLLKLAEELHVYPYRMDVESLGTKFPRSESISGRLFQTLKNAVDPQHLFSPGRYNNPSTL